MARFTIANLALPFLLACAAAGCAPVIARAETTALAPAEYATLKGADGGEPVANLAVRDQSGTELDSSRTVSFTTPRSRYRGTQVFPLADSIDVPAILELRVQANFRGPARQRQAWTWRIRNFSTGQWEKIGDNTGATDSVWSFFEFTVAGPASDYVDPDTRELQLRIDSKGALDDASLDFEAIIVRTPDCGETIRGGATGPVLYVSTSGNDENPGTLEAPWRTIQKAARTASPGATVLVRGGVYNETVAVGVSGNETAGYITFRNAPCETPVIDATGIAVPDSPNGLFLIVNQSHVRIEGFELRNYQTSRRDVVPAGIQVRGAAHHIELRNNRIHDIATNVTSRTGGDAHGIAVYGTEAPESIHDILIDGNELYDLKLGSSEALVLNGNVERFTVTNNIVHDANNIGIDLIGFEQTAPDPAFDQARDGIVAGNLVYNIDSFGNPAYGNDRSAGGIYVDGGRDIVIERNTVHHADIGIELASEHAGRATSRITLRNNFIHSCLVTGISIGGYDDERGSTEECLILNNTLLYNDTFETGTGEINLQFDTRSNTVVNNLIVAGDQGIFLSNAFEENSGNRVDFNCYFTTGEPLWQWRGRMYAGYDSYRSGTGNDGSSIFADPLLTDPRSPGYSVDPDSPVIDAGDPSADAGETDIGGGPRALGGRIDIGASEHAPETQSRSSTSSRARENTSSSMDSVSRPVKVFCWLG